MNDAGTALLAFSGLCVATYNGTALLIVLADGPIVPAGLVEAMGGYPPYSGIRRWMTVAYLVPMTALGIFVLSIPLVDQPGTKPDSLLGWLLFGAAWAILLTVMVILTRRMRESRRRRSGAA